MGKKIKKIKTLNKNIQRTLRETLLYIIDI